MKKEIYKNKNITIMKKIIFFTLIFSMIASVVPSQVKVNFSLTNGRMDQGYFAYDVIATVPAGQQWSVGPTNIRIYFNTDPPRALSVKADNPAVNVNTNLSGNSNYENMTTTSIMADTTNSLNIFLKKGASGYSLTPGTNTLGSVRWNVLVEGACINTMTLAISAIFDNLNPLTYLTQWTKTDTGCVPIGINLHFIQKVPVKYQLYQNYPNPFNPSTKIKFDIIKTTNAKIVIYDMLGRVVETLVNSQLRPGTYEATWNASGYSSGIYFFRLITDEYSATNKMVLMK